MATGTNSVTTSYESSDPSLDRTLDLVGANPLLRGRSVLLTGAAGGIGRVTARVLAAAGAMLVLVDVQEAPLHDLAEELRAGGCEAVSRAADASEFATFADLVALAIDRFGSLSGLVNCAGLWEPQDYDRITPESFDRNIRVTLQTAVAGCQAALPGMIERRQGSIVNFASTAGEYGSIRPAAHYAAAKAGVIGLTKSLAREAGPYGVRVNAVSPGPIDTAALGATTAEASVAIGARTLLGRLGRPEEIAGACAFLLSDLSTFVTGHVLRVNGGALI